MIRIMRQVFNISLGAGYGRLDGLIDFQSQRRGKIVDVIYRFYPFLLVSHDTATPDFTTAHFELGFYKNDQRSLVF